jgi:pimeloyl-ACP methyl ester carboxylesterase/DNA-binding SARP family transcriptional activator
MSGRLQISVLGELRIQRDGETVSLPPSRKTRALVAYLAVVGRSQRRDHLCELFWAIPDDPRASLRWSLTKLRRLLNQEGDECLTADRDSVFLDPARLDLDLRQLPYPDREALDELETQTLEGLAGRFRGPFLAGLGLPRCPRFEAWRTFHADALDELRVRILRALIGRLQDQPRRSMGYARALQDLRPDDEQLCRTVKELGARASVEDEAPPAAEPAAARAQKIGFCMTRDGVRIAYAVSGSGPPMVRAAHWMSHLQYDWESPVWRHWIDGLSERNTLIRYDERGNGLSDWNVGDFSFAAMLADLESVIDATGLDRFTLLGVSQSCAVAVAYAVRHPERVSGLILYGGYAKGWRRRANSHEIATHEAMTTLIREGWGQNNPVFRQIFTSMFIPGASSEQMAWFNELQRSTVSPENAGRLHESFGEMDVSVLLPQVGAPTLVLHSRRDAAVPFDAGRELAAGIPGAKLVVLDSANHILLEQEPAFARFLQEVRAFVAATVGGDSAASPS